MSGHAADTPVAEARLNTRLIQSVEVELSAYLGSARMTVGALTGLKKGAVVDLGVPLNQQVELHLKGVPVARGELVAVDDRFAVRLTEIVEWPA